MLSFIRDTGGPPLSGAWYTMESRPLVQKSSFRSKSTSTDDVSLTSEIGRTMSAV